MYAIRSYYAFVNVLVSGTTNGTVSNENGHFEFRNLTPGFIRVEASFVGYKKAISAEVEVNVASSHFLEIKMDKTDTEIDEVKVTASPFRKTLESPVSLRTIGVGEIEKSPGANRDISKVIQSFPGVQSTPAYRNDIIIRGGGPSESRITSYNVCYTKLLRMQSFITRASFFNSGNSRVIVFFFFINLFAFNLLLFYFTMFV